MELAKPLAMELFTLVKAPAGNGSRRLSWSAINLKACDLIWDSSSGCCRKCSWYLFVLPRFSTTGSRWWHCWGLSPPRALWDLQPSGGGSHPCGSIAMIWKLPPLLEKMKQGDAKGAVLAMAEEPQQKWEHYGQGTSLPPSGMREKVTLCFPTYQLQCKSQSEGLRSYLAKAQRGIPFS